MDSIQCAVLLAKLERFDWEVLQRATIGSHYEALLVPPHWLLTKRIQSRVFNAKRCSRMDVIGIVSEVLTDAGFTAEDLTVAT